MEETHEVTRSLALPWEPCVAFTQGVLGWAGLLLQPPVCLRVGLGAWHRSDSVPAHTWGAGPVVQMVSTLRPLCGSGFLHGVLLSSAVFVSRVRGKTKFVLSACCSGTALHKCVVARNREPCRALVCSSLAHTPLYWGIGRGQISLPFLSHVETFYSF